MNSTYFLVAKPSFLTGLARALDIGCKLPSYNLSDSSAEADFRALLNDWKIVGMDLCSAIEVIANERRAGKNG